MAKLMEAMRQVEELRKAKEQQNVSDDNASCSSEYVRSFLVRVEKKYQKISECLFGEY